ncbi:hypothetical protein BaRGS_00030454 [Batillaria attramentaria]|uniref:Uncharacterized protein n=1 Tax=Batillaria attramentaria TaxID=370345 RepID=A0ABD0JTK5_9CAEN
MHHLRGILPTNNIQSLAVHPLCKHAAPQAQTGQHKAYCKRQNATSRACPMPISSQASVTNGVDGQRAEFPPSILRTVRQ